MPTYAPPERAAPQPLRAPTPVQYRGKPVRYKLAIGPAHDSIERDADRMAERALTPIKAAASPTVPTPTHSAAPLPTHSAALPIATTALAGARPSMPLRRPSGAAAKAPPSHVAPPIIRPRHGAPSPALSAPPAYADKLDRLHREATRKLPRSVRRLFETRYGHSFEDVRYSDGAAADAATRQVGAIALTVGNVIAFRRGAFNPYSGAGKRLLGHELAHVVQQRNGAPARIQARSDINYNDPQITEQRRDFSPSVGKLVTLNSQDDTILFDKIKLSGFKKSTPRRAERYTERAGKLIRQRGYLRTRLRSAQQQSTVWRKYFGNSDKSPIHALLAARMRAAYHYEKLPPSVRQWVVGVPTAPGVYKYVLWHTKRRPTDALLLPQYGLTAAGNITFRKMQIEHMVELQIGDVAGDGSRPSDPTVLGIENLELLDGTINSQSGNVIKNDLLQRAKLHLSRWRAIQDSDTVPSVKQLKAKYHLKFSEAVASGPPMTVDRNAFWAKEQIKNGEHLAPVIAADASFRDKRGGAAPYVRVLFDAASKGHAVHYLWRHDTKTAQKVTIAAEKMLESSTPLIVTRKKFDTTLARVARAPLGTLWMNVSKRDPKYEHTASERAIPIKGIPSARFAGVIDTAALTASIKKEPFGIKKLSPIIFGDVSWSPQVGLTAKGKVQPDYAQQGKKQLVKDDRGKPDIVIRGNKTKFGGKVPADAVDPPGPITVVRSSIQFDNGNDGSIQVGGEVEVDIRDIAHGTLSATIGKDGFRLAGRLTAESSYFRSATVNLAYDSKEGISGGAELVLNTDKVPGVSQGKVSVAVENAKWKVTGSATFSALGIKGILTAGWSEKEGLLVRGRIPIEAGKVPGISGGYLEGRLRRDQEGNIHYGARGQIQPALPGVNSSINAVWDDGVFTATAQVGYQHGFLAGQLRVGVTNRAIGKKGKSAGKSTGKSTGKPAAKPAGKPTGKPTGKLSMFGGGSLNITLGEFIRGRADVDLSPSGEIVVRGEIGLAKELALFPRKEVSRRIFGIDLDIPVAGIVVLGKGFGVFAFVGGALDASASFGPAVLRNTSASITYNPAKPEDTVLGGTAELFLPAHAGLRLAIRAGVGGSLLIADVRGGLEVGGALGVDGHAKARIALNWSPKRGLSVDALAEAIAQPTFKFDISGFVEVNVALVGTVWEKRWKLAGFDLGSALNFGVRLPIRFQEGKPFHVGIKDVKFIIPNIDSRTLLKKLLAGTGTARGH